RARGEELRFLVHRHLADGLVAEVQRLGELHAGPPPPRSGGGLPERRGDAPPPVGVGEVFEDSSGCPRIHGVYRRVGTPSAFEMLSSAIMRMSCRPASSALTNVSHSISTCSLDSSAETVKPFGG